MIVEMSLFALTPLEAWSSVCACKLLKEVTPRSPVRRLETCGSAPRSRSSRRRCRCSASDVEAAAATVDPPGLLDKPAAPVRPDKAAGRAEPRGRKEEPAAPGRTAVAWLA